MLLSFQRVKQLVAIVSYSSIALNVTFLSCASKAFLHNDYGHICFDKICMGKVDPKAGVYDNNVLCK